MGLLLLSCLLCSPAAILAALIIRLRKKQPPPTDQPRRAYVVQVLAGWAMTLLGVAVFIGSHLLGHTGFVEENVGAAAMWGAFLGAPLGGVGAWGWGEFHYGWSRNPILGLLGAVMAAVLGMILGQMAMGALSAALHGARREPLLVVGAFVLLPLAPVIVAVAGYQLMRGGTRHLPPVLRRP